jgi:hypothetical protein
MELSFRTRANGTCTNNTDPTTVNLDPFKVNAVPEALTNPVAEGGAGVVVVPVAVVVGVVVGMGVVVGLLLGAVVAVLDGARHW